MRTGNLSTDVGDTPMSAIDTGFRTVGAPTTVRATMGTYDDRVEVSWTAVQGAVAYRVYRGTAGSPAGAPLVTTTDLSFTDTTGTAGVLYTYSIACMLTPSAQSAFFNSAGGWRNVPAPSNVLASDGTFDDRVRITWTPIVATPRYAVYRRLGSQTPQRIGLVTGSAFEDRTARPGVLYGYTVRSVVTPGESRDSLPNNGWRNNPNGSNPSGPDGAGGGGGGAGGMIASAQVDGGGRGGSASGLAAPVGSGGGHASGGPIDAAAGDDPLMVRIDPADPAWQLDCLQASREQLASAVLAGSRDSDGDGQPDLCQRERGDLDLNGRIDAGDIVLLLLVMGEDDPVIGDLDHDGCVGRADLAQLEDLVAEQAELDELQPATPPVDPPTPN